MKFDVSSGDDNNSDINKGDVYMTCANQLLWSKSNQASLVL